MFFAFIVFSKAFIVAFALRVTSSHHISVWHVCRRVRAFIHIAFHQYLILCVNVLKCIRKMLSQCPSVHHCDAFSYESFSQDDGHIRYRTFDASSSLSSITCIVPFRRWATASSISKVGLIFLRIDTSSSFCFIAGWHEKENRHHWDNVVVYCHRSQSDGDQPQIPPFLLHSSIPVLPFIVFVTKAHQSLRMDTIKSWHL